MSIDVLTKTIIDRPIGVVSAYSANPDNAPRWYGNITAISWQTVPPLRLGSRVSFSAEVMGQRLAFTYEVVELVPQRSLVMRASQGPFPIETTYTWRAIDETRTEMTLRTRGSLSGFAQLMEPVVIAEMRRANRGDLELLKAILERGNAPPVR